MSDITKISPLQSARKVFSRLDTLGVKEVIVGFSGGKDSMTVLDLCVKHFGAEHVRCFFLFTLPNLDCESQYVNLPTERYGIPVLQFPLPEIVGMLKMGYGRRYNANLDYLLDRKYRWAEVEKLVRYKTGLKWICYGHRQQDSLNRRGMLNRCLGVWETSYTGEKPVQRAYPIWQWTHKDVFSYLERHRLPIPHMFGSGVINTSGLSLMDAETLLYVKQHYPDDFKRLRRIFPGLETPIWRQEVLQRTYAQMDEDPGGKPGKTAAVESQQTAELFETEIAKILGLTKTTGNHAIDWYGKRQDGVEVGIELKVLNTADSGDRIQMRKSAKDRKTAWLSETQNKRIGLTLLIDNRDHYAGGKYRDSYSGCRFYYKAGFGAYRASTMVRCKTLGEIAQVIFHSVAVDVTGINREFAKLLKRTYG